jgi:hypothetical protein
VWSGPGTRSVPSGLPPDALVINTHTDLFLRGLSQGPEAVARVMGLARQMAGTLQGTCPRWMTICATSRLCGWRAAGEGGRERERGMGELILSMKALPP